MEHTAVSKPRKEYLDGLSDVTRNRDAVKGERAIKLKNVKYLPPLTSMCTTTSINDDIQSISVGCGVSAEGSSAYNKYLSLAQFYGATGRTVDGLTGLIFAKKATSEIPNNIIYMKNNIDSMGTTLREFSKKLSTEAFISPKSGILVARPSNPIGASNAEVEALNIRPKLLQYKYEDIINWHYDIFNNEMKLSLLVLVEIVTIRVGFSVESKKQYRVLELINGIYHQSLYDDGENIIEALAPVIINGKTSNSIPFFFIKVGAEDKSIINDLVDVNIHHYQLSADYNSKLYFSSFTIYYETGVQGVGSNNMIIGNGVKWNAGADATFGILQPDGNVDGHRIALQDEEKRMGTLGAQQLQPKSSGAESAEAKSIDSIAQNSTTADVAITVSEALSKALTFASYWQGGTEEAIYQLNTDYNPTGMNANDLNALFATYLGGGISYDTFYENLQKGEIANVDRTAEEEQKLLGDQQAGLE